jgi:high-affinity iron transporter
MFQIALVVFRECLEISMILGIIAVATKSIQNSLVYVTAGVMSGIIASALMAFIALRLNFSFGGYGDELINISIIFLAVLVVGATAIWVNNYSYKIANKMDDLALRIERGGTPKIMLILVVAVTIFREVTEIILFVSALTTAYELSPIDYLLGFVTGVGGSVVISIAIYYGLSKLAVKYLFRASFFMLVLIAASLASEAAGILTSIGLWNLHNVPLWDSSWLISDFSFVGKILKTLVGYNSQPNMLQVIFYLGTIGVIILCSKISVRGAK